MYVITNNFIFIFWLKIQLFYYFVTIRRIEVSMSIVVDAKMAKYNSIAQREHKSIVLINSSYLKLMSFCRLLSGFSVSISNGHTDWIQYFLARTKCPNAPR